MTDRERWIVYPLLFLALGTTLRDKLGPSTIVCGEVRCERLLIVDAKDRERVKLSTVQRSSSNGELVSSGRLEIHGYGGDLKSPAPLIELRSDGSGSRGQIIARSVDRSSEIDLEARAYGGGRVTLRGQRGQPTAELATSKGSSHLTLFRNGGQPKATITSGDRGGRLMLMSAENNVGLTLGHAFDGSGLVGTNFQGSHNLTELIPAMPYIHPAEQTEPGRPPEPEEGAPAAPEGPQTEEQPESKQAG